VVAGAAPIEEEMELRSLIQQIGMQHRRRYGYRRISAELRRRGMLANHKRVAAFMREETCWRCSRGNRADDKVASQAGSLI